MFFFFFFLSIFIFYLVLFFLFFFFPFRVTEKIYNFIDNRCTFIHSKILKQYKIQIVPLVVLLLLLQLADMFSENHGKTYWNLMKYRDIITIDLNTITTPSKIVNTPTTAIKLFILQWHIDGNFVLNL